MDFSPDFRPWRGTLLLLLVVAGLSLPATAAADGDLPFGDELRSRLVFVHPLVNYAVHPEWQRQWERSLASGNGVQVNVGSVTSADFLTAVRLNVSEPLAGRFRFLYRMNWLDALHVDRDHQQHWLGFEAGLWGRLAAQLQVHPAADKEEFDLMAGLLLTDRSRQRYLRLGLRFDDFMYGQKNDRGGTSQQEPVSLQWELRHRLGKWELFSSGRYGSRSARTYPDSTMSPTVAASDGKENGFTARLRYLPAVDQFVALETTHYDFAAAAARRGPERGYTYTNEFVHLRGLAVLTVTGPWKLRPEMHWLRQWASAAGDRNFSLHREDFFPAVFVELHAPGRSTWELGYLATSHRWDYRQNDRDAPFSGFTDKVKLGWTFAFTPVARITFSLSHEVDLDRFGGGNVQFQVIF